MENTKATTPEIKSKAVEILDNKINELRLKLQATTNAGSSNALLVALHEMIAVRRQVWQATDGAKQ